MRTVNLFLTADSNKGDGTMMNNGNKAFIEKIADLEKYISLSDGEKHIIEEASDMFPMRITPYYLSLIDPNDPDDPIRKLCIPSEDELDAAGSYDTSGENDNTILEGVQHKYAQTALVLSTQVCAAYCRHCFRKRMVGASDAELNKQVSEAVEYVRSHPEITNVLISGGDALMNPNHIIRRYLEELGEIETLDLIRIGTRIPVVMPSRIYENEELIEILKASAKKKPLYVVTQFDHPREITEEAERSVKTLLDIGVHVRNQTVLLRGVNDDPETLGTLLRKLTAIGVDPYYIFQCRPVKGVKKMFQVPFVEAVKIVDEAKNMQNGIGKSVRFAMSHPKGKIEILGMADSETMIFKFHQAKKAENASKIFTAKVKADTTWLDADLQGE